MTGWNLSMLKGVHFTCEARTGQRPDTWKAEKMYFNLLNISIPAV